MTFSAVIVAAGLGERAGPGGPKQWRLLAGRPVVRWSAEALLGAGARRMVVVGPRGEETLAERALAGLEGWTWTDGGARRDLSVRAGLAALGGDDDEIVLVHDAARPFVVRRHVESLLAALAEADGAIPALPMADTLKHRDPATGEVRTSPREGLWRAQTPQAFRLGTLTDAYAAWPEGEAPTDDAAVLERAGGRIALTPGDPMLMKLTYPEDFAMAEALAAGAGRTRVGQGFDVHAFGPGDRVWLCGVEIAHGAGLVGHSDADAGLHALTDALLGAIGLGDIGDHFPPTDPRWKDAPSSLFLEHAADLVAARGGAVVNVDVTLICEAPRIKPHREVMRARVAEILAVPVERVSVKATTTEGLGFAGRREGLAAQAIASVVLPL
ncbi:MAG: bifunctional 2-C-methyl-D-erythritol 4-phosphate cytidylyltransferase/2-C-methyl-D-erythritol 2,4-cyclodiphosphate synthase [Caulobacteraceae bacterium]|nr:bifunctional 2-C-methyl-D-erythritol 4-phosphate cytidylyltransferase/2-C-methyl-D-erythritol 2,4-cyclodiphosphate synthase [Caulobacteraceae bacterium]